MPFTTSHPAAVLPLKHMFPRYFSLTGLMAGAMSPDLLYFLLLDTEHRGISHSWLGLFTFCLPAGIIFSFAFHKLFKYHVILKLPHPLDRYLSGLAYEKFKINGLRGWLILIYSILIGTLSHYFWDSFTHSQGELARMIPFLLEESTIFGITRQNCTFVQHISTVIGAIVILVYALEYRLLPKPAIDKPIYRPNEKRRFWSLGIGFAVLFALIAVILQKSNYGRGILEFPSLLKVFKTFGLASWAGFFYFVCAYTLFFRPSEFEMDRFPPHDF